MENDRYNTGTGISNLIQVSVAQACSGKAAYSINHYLKVWVCLLVYYFLVCVFK